MTVFIFLASLLGSMAIGMPIAFALLICAMAIMLQLDNLNAQILAQKLIDGADSYPLMAIPFFLLAGEFMNAGGLSRRIVNAAMCLVGHLRGGLGYVVIGTGVALASLSGSAIADTATLAVMLAPMMRSSGYRMDRSAGLMAATGIIAPIIPPSIGFILLGVTANISITRLFIAGIFPGLLLGAALTFTWWWLCRRDNCYKPMPRATAAETWRAVKGAGWAMVLPAIIVGGLKFGAFTPTEAGVVAVAYAFIISIAVYRELTFAGLYEALLSAGKMTAVIMILVAASMVSAWLITVANVPQQVVGLLEPLIAHQTLLMLVLLVILLLVGTALDFAPSILILVPVLMPVIKVAGIDPIYFGVIFIIAAAIGMITPPVGAVLNTVCGVTRISMEDAVKGVWPFLLAEILVLLLLVLFPGLITVPASWLH